MKKFILLMLVAVNAYASPWECVSRTISCYTWRMSVPSGWVVSGDIGGSGNDDQYAMTFVPDSDHKWQI